MLKLFCKIGKKQMKKWHKRIIVIISIFVAFILGWFAKVYFSPKYTVTPVRLDSDQYKFINPILFLRISKDLFSGEYSSLNDSLNSEISQDASSGKADSVSVYFNDLNNGHWTGINEDDKYVPSSMLKVVALMSVLNYSESNPSFLSEKIYYSGPDDSTQYYKPNDNLSPGYYSAQNLINAMIVNSDNGAAEALVNNSEINEGFNNLYSEFRLPDATSTEIIDDTSPRAYSAVFRILYNGTSLSPNVDDQILSLLTKTNFTNGLVAGVPNNIQVAHKFGENTEADNNVVVGHELHDCGIVYYPNHPYLLCVMTRGKQFSDLESVISSVSKITYNFMQKKYK